MTSMLGSSSGVASGWTSFGNGLTQIENGLQACAEDAFWSELESSIEDCIEDVVPGVAEIADGYGGWAFYSHSVTF